VKQKYLYRFYDKFIHDNKGLILPVATSEYVLYEIALLWK